MPELPDVEGFRRRLARHAGRRRIRAVEVHDAGVVRNTSAAGLRRALTGRHLEQPVRRGKWLIAPTDGPVLMLHFGMTGSLEWNGAPHPHDRVVLHLDDGGRPRQHRQRRDPVAGAPAPRPAHRFARAVRLGPPAPLRGVGPANLGQSGPHPAAALRRTKAAGRTTLWCPSCQPPS